MPAAMPVAPEPAHPAPRALLFDIGRVVIRLDFARTFDAWAAAAGVPAATIAQRYVRDEHLDRLERGEIDASAFYQSLRDRLGVSLDDAHLEHGWNALLSDVEPAVVDAIARLRGTLPLFAFTNTSRPHRQVMDTRFGHAMGLFDRVFDSSLIGRMKPDPLAFRTVIDDIGLPPEEVLFFDDMADNVAGARALGLRAVQVRSADDVLVTLAPLLDGAPARP